MQQLLELLVLSQAGPKAGWLQYKMKVITLQKSSFQQRLLHSLHRGSNEGSITMFLTRVQGVQHGATKQKQKTTAEFGTRALGKVP